MNSGEVALREGIESATAAKLHVDEKAGAGGHLRGGGRLRPERHYFAVLGLVRDGAGLGHVHRVAPYRQPGRDFFFLMIRLPPISTLFPYTTLITSRSR